MLLSRQEIAAVVERLASEVRRDYHPLTMSLSKGERMEAPPPARGSTGSPRAEGTPPLLVGILKGAFVFMADLVRALDMPVAVDFVRISTYGRGTQSTKRPRIAQGVRSPIKGRHVLVVEDIVDTGVTTRFLLDYLRGRDAASVTLCALLSKPARRQVDIPIDYLGFTIPNVFVVGYGVDFAELYRHLPDICILEGK